jgi:protein gp37
MPKNKIGWCDKTVNAVDGCTFGCPFCYARGYNDRFHYVEDFSKPQFFSDRLKSLYSKKPKTIFMDSMSDIADWKPEWLEAVYKAMADNSHHKYIFLTKRPGKLLALEINGKLAKGENIWYGTSITGDSHPYPFQSRALYNALFSFEPLLAPISEWGYAFEAISKKGIQWVIIGAETGNRKEKVIPQRKWIQDIVDQCRAANVPIFLKSSLKDIWGEPLIQEFPW